MLKTSIHSMLCFYLNVWVTLKGVIYMLLKNVLLESHTCTMKIELLEIPRIYFVTDTVLIFDNEGDLSRGGTKLR